jgi:hypothetical protein
MVGGDELSLDITPDEAELGFELASGAVVLVMGRGLCAVKIQSKASGAIRYAICDEAMQLLYPPASSLEELGTRFPALVEERERTA